MTKELRIRKHCFSLCFSDGFNNTNISSSVVKQDERNSSFLWSKIIFDASKKTLRKGKFWQERKKMPSFPPPTPCLDKMTQDIKISKFLNIWLKWQIVNGFKLEVNGL